MSVYRFFRASALMTLAARYRGKLYRLALAAAVAMTSAWLYGDIASYLDSHHPDTLWLALFVKTVVVYGALVYAFWQLRPADNGISEAAGDSASRPKQVSTTSVSGGPLDALMEKPKLTTRREALLAGKDRKTP